MRARRRCTGVAAHFEAEHEGCASLSAFEPRACLRARAYRSQRASGVVLPADMPFWKRRSGLAQREEHEASVSVCVCVWEGEEDEEEESFPGCVCTSDVRGA